MNGINSVAYAGMVFLLYLFIMVTLFLLLSGPVDTIMTAFDDGSVGTEYETEMNLYHDNYVLAIKIAFVLGITTPLTWLVMWVYSQEAAHYQYRRRF